MTTTMFKTFVQPDDVSKATFANDDARRDWTVLLPFFNERDFLEGTLASLARQSEPPLVILIDNGSTDGSGAIARAACVRLRLAHVLLREMTPGKVAALASGFALVSTPYVATCDADTWYPETYLANARAVLERGDCAAAGAYFVAADATAWQRMRKALHTVAAAALLPGQCHTGGAGQVFRTEALRRAGGFDPSRWNMVLEDHEIMHRVRDHGRLGYHSALWCAPAPRERDRNSTRWTLAERLCYHATTAWAGDWFFYGFLADRLAARRLSSERLRERAYHDIPATALAA
jgi:glycosyltransferase involved in cell wall biosynthesis